MADLPEGLLDAVKAYLHITWQDDATDSTVTGYINRGMKRLQTIAGASLDFTEEDQPRALLFDYCRYANSQALEVFEKNFEAELLDLNFRTQAPVIDSLTVILSAASIGAFVKVSPTPDEGNGYVFKVGAGLSVPERLEICLPGSGWTAWQDKTVPASPGNEILLVEINDRYEAERAGMAVVPG